MHGQLFPERLANDAWIRCIDRSMQRSLGWGLSHYVCKKRSRPLAEGESRYTAVAQTPDGRPMKRVCIECADKRSEFEVHRAFRGENEVVPVFHMAIDQGSIGWAGSVYLMQRLRMTLTPDWLHRVVNDYQLALGRTNMIGIRRSFKVLSKLRRGAWKNDGNHELLRRTASEMFSCHSHGYVLFQALLSELFTEQSVTLGAEQGSERQQVQLWGQLRLDLSEAPLGMEMKASRWWSIETVGRYLMRRRWRVTLLLLHLGTMRKWWKIGSNPLFGQASIAVDNGDPIPGVDGLLGQKWIHTRKKILTKISPKNFFSALSSQF